MLLLASLLFQVQAYPPDPPVPQREFLTACTTGGGLAGYVNGRDPEAAIYSGPRRTVAISVVYQTIPADPSTPVLVFDAQMPTEQRITSWARAGVVRQASTVTLLNPLVQSGGAAAAYCLRLLD